MFMASPEPQQATSHVACSIFAPTFSIKSNECTKQQLYAAQQCSNTEQVFSSYCTVGQDAVNVGGDESPARHYREEYVSCFNRSSRSISQRLFQKEREGRLRCGAMDNRPSAEGMRLRSPNRAPTRLSLCAGKQCIRADDMLMGTAML